MKTTPAALAALLVQGLLMMAAPLYAEEAVATDPAKPAMTLSGSITLVNDYVWRGQSQTWGRPALQIGLEGNHTSGLYVGTWASNVSDQSMPAGHVETDFYAGYRSKLPGALAAVNYDLNILAAYYPGANFEKSGFTNPRLKSQRPTGVEASLALNYQWLTIKAGSILTPFYGWNIDNSYKGAYAGDPNAGVTGTTRGSWFAEASASIEFSPGWSVNGQLGHETIRNSDNLSWSYYKAGLTRIIGPWSASLAWSASNEPDAFKDFVGLTNNGDTYDLMRPRALLSVTRSF